MKMKRREFVQLAGIATLGIVIKPTLDLLERAETSGDNNIKAKRLVMAINLKSCPTDDGCRDCIDACHSIHNVPDLGNPKDEIKWIWTTPYKQVFEEQEHDYTDAKLSEEPILLMCNHCDNPPCVKVCPTQATYRRSDGLVVQDYHRCIGCRYCMAACPYGSRSFNWKDPNPFIKNATTGYPKRTQGVVEKCNFCEERLALGKVPACVEACKYNGLVFGDANDPKSEVRQLISSGQVLRRKPNLGTRPQVYYIL